MEAIATRKAYGLALAELGEKNKDIVALDADLSCSTKSEEFGKKFQSTENELDKEIESLIKGGD